MKVALLIFPIHYSHGCILQTYALYKELKELGHSVTILDRQPEKITIARNIVSNAKRLASQIFKGYKGAVFYWGRYPKSVMKEQERFIDTFRRDIISVYSTKGLKKCVDKGEYDVIVVGSDQTWRPIYVSNVLDYWLDFAKDNSLKKVAYAPSFGVDKWEYSDNLTEKCRYLCKLFDKLSVREIGGVELCKKYLNIEVSHVLDPTLLWDKNFYIKFAKKVTMQSNLCQCYFLDMTNEKKEISRKVAEIKNLTINYINTQTEDNNAPLNKRVAPSVEKWLAGFYYGDFAVVDSFHAMVFSIIFHCPFIVIGNFDRGLSRFESVLSELGLLDRLISPTGDVSRLLEYDIDWDEVDRKLGKHRTSSIDYLKSALDN